MQLKLVLLIFLSLALHPRTSYALSVSGVLGFGQATMTNEATETEGPLAMTWSVERLFHTRLALGVEHIRSLTTSLTTSASFTGLVARYYINSSPSKLSSVEALNYDTIVTRDVSLFVGIGMGYAQSSRLPNDVGLSSNAAGFYLSPRGGVDYQINTQLGLRGELLYATSIIGTGSLQIFSVGAGLYWLF